MDEKKIHIVEIKIKLGKIKCQKLKFEIGKRTCYVDQVSERRGDDGEDLAHVT